MDELMRHVSTAHALRLPGHYRVLRLGAEPVGFVTAAVAERLVVMGCGESGGDVVMSGGDALARCEAGLAAAGLFRLRGEAFDVRAVPGGPVLARVDRGALPCLGIAAEGVHVNGLVRGHDGWRLWVAKRSASKALDPGKLDQLVAGGICAGMDAAETLVKEAAEEAGISEALARQARFVGVINYAMERPEGLRRDTLHCYDLELPADFVPVAQDGEVESFSLMRIADAAALARNTDAFKFNVNLVLAALFERLATEPGMLPPGAIV